MPLIPALRDAKSGRSLWVQVYKLSPGQPGLHIETLSQKIVFSSFSFSFGKHSTDTIQKVQFGIQSSPHYQENKTHTYVSNNNQVIRKAIVYSAEQDETALVIYSLVLFYYFLAVLGIKPGVSHLLAIALALKYIPAPKDAGLRL